MSLPALILTGLIAALHFYIAWFEMFAWESRGPKIFKNFPKELFTPTKMLAQNQGIYNAFLAAGLTWALFISDPVWQPRIAICFLLFVAVAGLVGAATASRRILYIQTVPAVVAIALILIF